MNFTFTGAGKAGSNFAGKRPDGAHCEFTAAPDYAITGHILAFGGSFWPQPGDPWFEQPPFDAVDELKPRRLRLSVDGVAACRAAQERKEAAVALTPTPCTCEMCCPRPAASHYATRMAVAA